MNRALSPLLGRRGHHIYWVIETSGATKHCIAAVNEAFREVTEFVRDYGLHMTRFDTFVHALQYDDGARWVSDDFRKGIAARDFSWSNELVARGMSDLGCALEILAAELSTLPQNAFPPVLCLLHTCTPSDRFEHGLQQLFSTGWGEVALRLSIAIGGDADTKSVEPFCANNRPVDGIHTADLMLHAHDSRQLVASIHSAFDIALKYPWLVCRERPPRSKEATEWFQ